MSTNRHRPRLIHLLATTLLLGGCLSGDPNAGLLSDLVEPLALPTPTEAAMDMLDMNSADNRRRGVSLISASPFGGEEAYLKVYRELIRDPDPTVRAACARALGLHGGPEDAPLLARAVENDAERDPTDPTTPLIRYREPDAMVRWEAARALRKIHNPTVVGPLLTALLRDEDADVRAAAATALGQYPQLEVFDALLQGLLDNQFRVVHASRIALTTLTGYDLGPDQDDWLTYRRINREQLFADQQIYTYTPWVAPPGFFEKLMFWTDSRRAKAEPVVPVGL